MIKTKPGLQGEAFELLLGWLHTDRTVAATEYVRLHAGLTKMFESRGCIGPHDCADETFNRVARQLSDGKEIAAEKPAVYLYGVARYIVREQWVKPKHDDIDEVQPEKLVHDGERVAEELSEQKEKDDCLDDCLNDLPEDSRLLVLRYYSEDESSKKDTRDRMARELGIASGVLRNRIYKLRNILRDCMYNCLEN